MKKIILLLFLSCTVIGFSHCASDTDGSTDIDNHVWKLQGVATISGFSSQVPIIQWQVDNRYLLSFDRVDHTIRMFLIVNEWMGWYSLFGQDSIRMQGSTTTELGYVGDDIWIEDTLNRYGSANYRYCVYGSSLVLKSDSLMLVFSKER